jgi:hypothetical protein
MISMSGLDLSFLKEPEKKKRGRPRKQPVKAKSEYQRQMDEIKARAASRPSKRADFGAPLVMQDIVPFISPIDGTEITSRSKLKAHEQKHGVKQCGDYKPGEIIAKQKKRAAAEAKLAEPETVKWE